MTSERSPPMVCLGASAGGLEALEQFLGAVPDGTGAVYVVVVHLSPDFESRMSELLAKRSAMPVRQVTSTLVPVPEHVYVIPPGRNLDLVEGALTLLEQPRGPGAPINLPIDHFLVAMAREVGERSIAVLLSGSGSDGSRGIRAVKDAGGSVLVQDPESARFDGMPRAALSAGLFDHVGAPNDLAVRVGHLCRAEPMPDVFAEVDEDDPIEPILELLRHGTGTELRWYRRGMMIRRIQRRMAICGIGQLDNYLALLESSSRELGLLRQDLLIGVTQFFRDVDAFHALRAALSDELRDRDPAHDPLRIWCSACSTGQEAYSLAIVALQAMEEVGRRLPVKVFATDVNDVALAHASRGTYSSSEVADLPDVYVERYFVQQGDEVTVSRELREMVIFAPHNVVGDPPFTRMDVVACRNLLIFFDSLAQERALASLHYALRPDTGLLFLGRAEVAPSLEGRVETISERHRILRRSGPSRMPLFVPPSRDPSRVSARGPRPTRARREAVLEARLEASRTTGAALTKDGRIVELVTDPEGFFTLGKGAPRSDIDGLLPLDLVAAIKSQFAQMDADEAQTSSMRVQQLGGHEVILELARLPDRSEEGSGLFWLELRRTEVERTESSFTLDEAARARVQQLEDEIRTTRETLQGAIEELQSTNQEQQSANEELVAANEELQSTNEELHSVNEELFTVNAEFQRKNNELMVMTADLDNLLLSADLTTMFLDAELCVRRFSPGIERIIPLIGSDVGRPIRELAHRLTHDFVVDAEQVAANGGDVTREVRDVRGSWLTMRLRPYRTDADGATGVLVTFVDVTRLKHAEASFEATTEALTRANAALMEQAQQLEDMFSVVAHDVKRPMLLLDGRLVLAREAIPDDDPRAEQLDAALHVVAQVRRMLKDLSVLTDHGQLVIEPEAVDLQPWFEEVLERFRVRAREQGVRLQGICDAGTIQFARGAGEVALANLVENALLHGTTADQPRIDVTCRVRPGTVELVVADNGRGIAHRDQERIFELFRRLDPSETDGTGVGLVSVRRVAERAGGSVRVHSAPGRGSRFVLTLPVRSELQDTRVLVVEDDHVDVEVVRRAVPELDLRVESTLSSARAALREQEFDLVLLDFALPDGHGIELVPIIRERDVHAEIVVFSGVVSDLEREAVRGFGRISVYRKNQLPGPELRKVLLDRLGSSRIHEV